MIDDRYRQDLSRGLAFEQLLAERWGKRHSETFEQEVDIEIKFDSMWRRTGNLFIETEERGTIYDPWRPAGIFHPGVPHFFMIGDENTQFLFLTSALVTYAKSATIITNKTDTGRGFLLPANKRGRHPHWSEQKAFGSRLERVS